MAISEKSKDLLTAQALLFIVFRFRGTAEERKTVVDRAKAEMSHHASFGALLEFEGVGSQDVEMYYREAVESLHGVKSDEARDLIGDYRRKMARKLGVELSKEGARLLKEDRKGAA